MARAPSGSACGRKTMARSASTVATVSRRRANTNSSSASSATVSSCIAARHTVEPRGQHREPTARFLMPQRILLVHGLLNSDYWLTVLSRRLRAEGFDTALFGYGSVFGGPEKAVARLRPRLQAEHSDALVGHSRGGLVALEAVRQAPHSTVSRLVCLGTPRRGS